MTHRPFFANAVWAILTASALGGSGVVSPQTLIPGSLTTAIGLRLVVDEANAQPVLRIVLPDAPESDRTIEIIFPEHVTGRRHGQTNAERLYLFRPGDSGGRPRWRQRGQSVEYEMDIAGAVAFHARATLEDDGVCVRYEFRNRSDLAYDMIYAVTDPRLTGRFHDVRLERTYVHHKDGFELLASETPHRLSMPLAEWLPARYLVSYTWPVPAQRVDRRGDGITYYHKSRAVDQPFIATLSTDRTWVVASVARDPGNVWSNPQLTCQHVDPQVALAAKGEATAEVKILILRGSLADAYTRAIAQRSSLK